MAILKIENISKEYDFKDERSFALKDINLDIQNGECIVIMGASGSGKSTLLNIISSLDKGTSGNIFFKNKNINILSEKQLSLYRQNSIGMVFQSFNLIQSKTIKDNLKIVRLISNKNKKTIDQDIDNILDKFKLLNKKNYTPNMLSGGQQQKVAIARALMNNPDIVVADEPTGNLDTKSGNQIIQMLNDLNKKDGKTVIIVTHNEEIEKIADRVVYLKDGQIEKIEVKNKDFKPIENKQGESSKFQKGLSYLSSIKFSLNTMRHVKARTIISAFGIAVGIAVLVLLVSFAQSLNQDVTNSFTSVMSLKQISITSKSLSPSAMFGGAVSVTGTIKPLNNNSIHQIQKIPNVVNVYVLNKYMGTITYKNKSTTLLAISSPPVKYVQKSLEPIAYGRRFNSNNEKSIIITKAIAHSFGFKHSKNILGKTISVNLSLIVDMPKGSNIKPFKGNLKVIGIYEISGITAISVIPYDLYMQKGSNSQYMSLMANVSNINDVKNVENKINNLGYSTISTQSIISTINNVFLVIQGVLSVIGLIALFVAALGIINIMIISVLERFKEIGILKAVGATKRDIKRIFLSEGAIIGATGGIIGIIMGEGIGFIISNVLSQTLGESAVNLFQIDWPIIIGALVIAIVIATLASIYPARRASKLNPVETLRRE